MKKRFVALLLCTVLGMSTLAGCGNQKQNNPVSSEQTTQQQEYVYVPTYFDWGVKIGANDWINTYGTIHGYQVGMYYSYREEDYKQTQELWMMSLKDQTVKKIPITLEDEDAYVSSVTVQEDGTPVVCVQKYEWDETSMSGSSTYRILRLDENGATMSDIDITEIIDTLKKEDDWVYLENIIVDKENILYLQFNQQVVVIKEDGTQDFMIPVEQYVQNAGVMPDGSVYVTYYEKDGYELCTINKETKSLEKKYELTDSLYGTFEVSADYKLYYSDGSAVRAIDLASGNVEKVADWLDCDINGSNINGVYCENEDEIYAYYNDWETDEEYFVKLTKTESSQVKEKTILTLATLYSSDDMKKNVVAFNKANETYRIKVVSYIDYSSMTQSDYDNYEQYVSDAVNRLKNDLTGNNPPDILSLSEDGGMLSMETLVQKGVLEELTPYLQQAGYTTDDFVDGVVNSYMIDNKLYALPSQFAIMTAIANAEVVGTESGWTLAEAMEIAQNLPEGMQFLETMTQENVLQSLLQYGYSSFMDETENTCSFDSDEFKALLTIAKTFPKEYDYDVDAPVSPILLSSGELLMTAETIGSLEDIQLCEAYFGELDATFIGLPGTSGNGSLITPYDGMYGICAKSEHKQVAAEFIIDILTKDYEERGRYAYGFPSYEKALEDYIADQIDIEYVKDDEGNLVLDEEGNPIPMQGGSGIGWGDWSYDYRPCTQEDADKLMELMNGACTTAHYDTEIFNIISEEVQPYFNDQKSAEEVASIIQNRISLYLSENS